jgi:hypothetical protein
MDLEKLQKIFPNWIIFTKCDCIYVTNKYFECCYNVYDINKMIDIYNSIDYIIEFLLNNDFKHVKTSCNAIYFNVDLCIHILIDIQNCYIYNKYENYYEPYSSNDFIVKIKELIEYENPFKKVQNE